MSAEILLTICASVLFFLLLIRRNYYGVSFLKCVLLTVIIGSVGMFGTYALYYIENGTFGGQSFFGAVLFFPIFLLPVAKVMRMRLFDLLGYATPPGMAMLVLFKFNCYLGGCCGGKALFFSDEGIPVHFPSQIVEMGVAFVIAFMLFMFERKSKRMVYPACLVLYGFTRFVLNWFRSDQNLYVFGLSAGHFWSILSVLIGVVLLLVMMYSQRKCDYK